VGPTASLDVFEEKNLLPVYGFELRTVQHVVYSLHRPRHSDVPISISAILILSSLYIRVFQVVFYHHAPSPYII
jgi:hypothetical protein